MICRTLVAMLVTALGGVARAEDCAPSVKLAGDPELVAAITRELDARGLVLDEHCPGVHASIEKRGAELVITIDNPDGSSTTRTVNELATAATVIESFTRTDVAMPLLAARAVPPPPPPRAVSHDESPVAIVAPHERIELSASFESSFANDRTTWLGASIKVCIHVGPICAAARYRTGNVVAGFASDGDRHLDEVLIGVDVPFALGPVLLAPGFAGGMGGMHTRVGDMKRASGAFHAEAQAALSIPIVRKLAIDVSLGAGFGGEQNDAEPQLTMVPAEPWVLYRAGVGLRYTR